VRFKWSNSKRARRGPPGKRTLVLGLALGASLATGLAIGVTMLSSSPAEADPDRQGRVPGWHLPLVAADAARARFDGELAGIVLGPHQELPTVCGVADDAHAVRDLSVADGDPLAISPSYLPPGTALVGDPPIVGVCNGQIVLTEARYWSPGDPTTGRFGGALTIVRFQGPRTVPLDHPADRVRAIEVNGRPAAIADPLTEDGFGHSVLAVNEEWGLTIIDANGITSAELIEIARGLNGAR